MDYIDYKFASEELRKTAQDVVFEAIEKNASDLGMHPDDYLIELGMLKAAEYMDKIAYPELKTPKPLSGRRHKKYVEPNRAIRNNPKYQEKRISRRVARNEEAKKSKVINEYLRGEELKKMMEPTFQDKVDDYKRKGLGHYENALRSLGNVGKGDKTDMSQQGLTEARSRGKKRAIIGGSVLGAGALAGGYALSRKKDDEEKKASSNSYANELVERAKQQLYGN
jgi:hypothetical protein